MTIGHGRALAIGAAASCAALMLAGAVPAMLASSATAATADPLIAVIGDFGSGTQPERQVADLVARARPLTVVTTGDNVYGPAGYAALVGDYYGRWVRAGQFLPATGNHDYAQGIAAFDAYFAMLHGQRVYTAVRGPVAFFILDSQSALDSSTAMSRQRTWLRAALLRSSARWKVVVLHHPPFSSGLAHGSSPLFRWPFAAWGVDLVLAGHEHNYERIRAGPVTYVVDGSGGKDLYPLATALPGSQARDDVDHGALFLRPTSGALVGEFRTTAGRVVDRFSIPG